jgi:sulfate adenylyltransferase subunit 1 (EFTu-like GTPase family)
VSTRLQTNIIWLGKKPFVAGRDYKLKLGTAASGAAGKINKVIDASAQGDSRLEKDNVGRHDVATSSWS